MTILTPVTQPLLIQWHAEQIPLAEQARRLGCAESSLVRVRRRLAAQGLITLAPHKTWTKHDEYELDTLIGQGLGYADIGRRMGRPASVVYRHCRRRGTPITKATGFQWANDVAADLGVSGRRVAAWIEQGYLKATNIKAAGLPLWRVQLLDLMDFLENSSYWMLWEPAGISDHALREWAVEARRHGPQWIIIRDVAARLHLAVATVHAWIINGWLPAQRRGHIWYVDGRNLEAITARREREEHATRSAAGRYDRARRRQQQEAINANTRH